MRWYILVLLMCAGSVGVWAESYFAPFGGLGFPSITRNLPQFGDRTFWRVGIEWGGLTEARVGVGGSFEIDWKWNTSATNFDEARETSPFDGDIETYEVDHEVRRTLLPLMFALFFDPLPHAPVHPVVRGSFGPAMLIYTNRQYLEDTLETYFGIDIDRNEVELSTHSGIYWGSAATLGGELYVSLGSDASFFFGSEYRWCAVTKRKWGSQVRYRQDLSGLVLRLGFRFL